MTGGYKPDSKTYNVGLSYISALHKEHRSQSTNPSRSTSILNRKEQGALW